MPAAMHRVAGSTKTETFELHEKVAGVWTAVSLGGRYSAIKAILKLDTGGTVQKTYTISGTSASFSWSAGDLVAGAHKLEIECTPLAGGAPEVYPDEEPIAVLVRARV